ncbi:MAG TPA: GAF domain-containing protein [Nitrospiria bacterium]|nr:GAF domain-containing protein [Nitrospiria bacterium]
MEKDKEPEIFRRADEFLGVFHKGIEFTNDLLKENERLRFAVAQMAEQAKAAQKSTPSAELTRLRQQIDELAAEREAILNRYKLVEEENKDFASRYVEVEEENNNLANLYVASYQLHSTMDLKEVLRIVSEIILNLIGSDHFAILTRDEEEPVLHVAAAETMDPKVEKIKLGEGMIGRVAQTGEPFVQEDLEHTVVSSPDRPIVCIPLKIHDTVIGVIAIFDLFEQKRKRLTRVDHELFSMLAGHAATAIFSAMLYTRSQRSLSTIKDFLGLMKNKAA